MGTVRTVSLSPDEICQGRHITLPGRAGHCRLRKQWGRGWGEKGACSENDTNLEDPVGLRRDWGGKQGQCPGEALDAT